MIWNVVEKLFPIVSWLRLIWSVILGFWSWIGRNVAWMKVPFFFSMTYASIRAAVGMMGILITKIQAIKNTVQVTGLDMASAGAPSGTLLDKVNAVLPVGETLAFIVAYGAIVMLTTAYMFLKHLYNAVPLKAT